MVAIFIAVAFGTLAALAARARGRNSLGWFVAGAVVGPFALIVALLPLVPRAGVSVECPRCAQVIRAGAKACHYCGQLLLGGDRLDDL